MAKSLQERLASARETDRTTIETLEKLIEDVRAERARLAAAHERASADSIDFALSEDDREEAAANAGRYARSLATFAGAVEELEAKLATKRNSDAQRAKAAEKAAAVAERDEIAAIFADRVPAIVAELIELFESVQANEHRMRAAGVHEANAEFKARGLPGNGIVHGAPVLEFAKMKIPEFHGAARAWPVDAWNAMMGARADDMHRRILRGREETERKEREKAEAAAKFAREHGRYEITVPYAIEHGDSVVRVPDELVSGDIPGAMGPWDRKELLIRHDVAERLAAVPRLKVELMDEGKS